MEKKRPPVESGQALSGRLRRRVFSLPTLLSFGVAVVSIVFLATRFDLNWAETMENVRTMNPWLYFSAFFVHYTGFVLRASRWRTLVQNASRGETTTVRPPSVIRFLQIILIGWFVNSVAWLRLGDAYRAYLLSEHTRAGFSWSLGTILAERILDLAAITVLIGAGALLVSTSTLLGPSNYVFAAAFMMASGIIFLVLMKRFGDRLANVLPARLAGAYHRLEKGVLGSMNRIPLLVTLSLAVWLLEGSRLLLVVRSLDLMITLPLVLIVTMAHAILATVPTPGGVGAVEVGVTGLLVLTGTARSDAGAVVVVERSITFISVIGVGGLLFLLKQSTNLQMWRRWPRAMPGSRRKDSEVDA